MLEKSVMGFEGFVWAIGVVEDRQDPLGLGRVRARAWGLHSDKLTDIPTEDLPWASVASSVNLQLKETDSVLMFFADGYSCQIPVIIAKLEGFYIGNNNPGLGFNDVRTTAVLQDAPRPPSQWQYNSDGSGITVTSPSVASAHPTQQELGQPTISSAADFNIANTVIQQRFNNLDKNVPCAGGITWSEPVPAYNPKYPYNKSYQSESGHFIEVDDTPGDERLSWMHRTGTFTEMYPSGTKVQKITKSNYSIVMGDEYVHIMGRCLLTVGQGAYIRVIGDANIECDNDVNLGIAGNFTASVGGAFNIKAQQLNLDIAEDFVLAPGGDLYLSPGGDLQAVPGGTGFLTASDVEITGGTVRIAGGSVSIQQGSSPGSTSTPPSVPAAPAQQSPTTGSAGVEPTPVPWQENFAKLTPYSAQALKQSMYLSANGAAPDANAANTPCGFDPNVHTFLQQPWAISQNGLLQIQQREGFGKALANGSCQAYPDPIVGPSLLTIGFGTTSCVLPSNLALTPETIITQETARQYLLDAVNNTFLPYLQQVVSIPLTQNMIDALLSFMYNVGLNNFATSSVLKYTNQQSYCAAGNAFLLWNKSNGQIVAGLTTRRTSEKNQFLT